jgi:hypothetical protein
VPQAEIGTSHEVEGTGTEKGRLKWRANELSLDKQIHRIGEKYIGFMLLRDELPSFIRSGKQFGGRTKTS